MKKEVVTKNKETSLKNYLILLLIAVVTFITVFYLGNWYKTTEAYWSKTSDMVSVISEVKLNELNNYLLENPNTIIYISSGEDESIKEFEKSFKELIIEYDLRDEIIYLDQKLFENQKDYQDFIDQYFHEDMKYAKFVLPNLLVVENRKVVALLNTGNQPLEKEATINFLKQHGVISEA